MSKQNAAYYCKSAAFLRLITRANFIIDLLTSDLNSYKSLLPTDVKNYLSRIVGRDIK